MRSSEDDAKKTKSVFCFAVAPEYHGKGIAAALLERVCLDAAEDLLQKDDINSRKDSAIGGK